MNKPLCKFFIASAFISFMTLGLFAHGAKDVEEKSVQKLESWQESFDLEGKKPGKYNIMVTATDLGGNQIIEGPYNLYVDPKSDLPICGITNPHQDMRIVGNLNIVGTCVDDDAVQYVDLILDGDEEHPVRAIGKEFWSYYLDTTKLEEGLHTIKVIGCDINGLVGNPTVLTWNLDRRQPVTAVDNQVMGTLVSGNVKLHGTVADGNGIKSLAYSVDHGVTFKDIKLSRKKDNVEFDISIDTRKFADGPSVVWFKAVDNAGSAGVYSFLYFIDNTSPEVKVIQPIDKTPQYGKVTIAGYAKDTIGITSLNWSFGKETGEFEVIPGNPFWAKEFDLAGVTEKNRKFSITAKDNAGNVITVSQNVVIDESLDKPKITIVYPNASALVETNDVVYIRGIAEDEDGIASVKYKVDNGAWIEEETKGVFYGILGKGSEISGGKHTVTAVAIDRHGVQGDPVTAEFSALGAIPVFSEAKIGGQTVVNGMQVHPEAGLTFSTTVSSSIGLNSVHWEVNWGTNGVRQGDFTIEKGNSQTVNIPINDDLPKGIAKIYITAKDTLGRVREYKALLDITNTSIITTAKPEVEVTEGTVENGRVSNKKTRSVNPVIKISGASDSELKDGSSGEVTVTGSASNVDGTLTYQVFTSLAAITAGQVTGMGPVTPGPVTELNKGNSFSIPVNTSGYGIYFVEVTGTTSAGKKSSAVIAYKNIPELPEGAKGGAKAPMIVWADGSDVYYGVAYQGEIEKDFGVYKRSEMPAGTNNLSANVQAGDKTVSSAYKANKVPEIEAAFATLSGKPFQNGQIIKVAKGSSDVLVAYAECDMAVTATYEISGDAVPGGNAKNTGAAKVSKGERDNLYIIEIPVENLPVRYNVVKLSVKAGAVTKDITGLFGLVRPIPVDMIDDARAVYAIQHSDSVYDRDTRSYIMKPGEAFSLYANTTEIESADLLTASDGLSVERSGNLVKIIPSKDGSFSGVGIRARVAGANSVDSSTYNFIVDSGAPEVTISTPALHQWVKNTVKITGTAADPSGVKTAEYSIDGGENWKPLYLSATGRSAQGATFSGTADITSLPEGVVGIDVRVFDVAGNYSVTRTACQKDVTPPEVKIIVPHDDAIVNGDNLIAFNVKDNYDFEKTVYLAPPSSKAGRKELEFVSGTCAMTHVGTAEQPIDDGMSFEFVDGCGNVTTYEAWKFLIDNKSDLPVSEIHLPTYEDVVTRDFTISGVIYDDDGPATIYYQIDNASFVKLEGLGTSFAIDVPFSSMTDNEHVVRVYAVDINGVRGPTAERKFRVSLEEPKGAVETPTIDKSNKGVITLTGVASDKNGIEKVLVSLDNGNSYNNAVGTTNWTYTFDSRAIPNGTNVVFIKIFDKYGIQGLYSSLINIDNEAPEMILDYPLDYSSTAGPLFFSGYAFDNVNITDLYISIRSLDGKTVPGRLARIDFQLDRIIAQAIDISGLDNGSYNIELTALDKAKNATHISRNILLNKSKALATVNLLYPLNGEHKQGSFNIYGSTEADKQVEKLSLYIDDKLVQETVLTASDYFKFNLNPENISDGVHNYRVDATVEGGQVIRSRVQTVEYSSIGPWLTIDNFTYGDFAMNRPYIMGHAGYAYSEEEKIISKTKKATAEQKAAIAAKKVKKIEVSFDNGKTFEQVSSNEKWMYRVENQDIAEGYHFMLVRAKMRNGETAVERAIIQIDNTSPKIRLISPSAGGRYNQQLVFSGLSSDEVGLKDVSLTLRKGDKASYEVPSFIQGLYVDWHFWGATLFDIGVGLTFFDDVVKVQFQWGQFTQEQRDMFSNTDERYGGDNVMGIKILANIANLPFSYMLGRDFEWLSANIALGAQFTRFNSTASGEPQILSAILAQVEFPKVTFPNMKCFSSFSLYTEFALWFIPTDVSSSGDSIQNMVPQIAEGIRLSVF